GQRDFGSFGTSDKLHDITQLHVDNGDRLSPVLRYRDDFVLRAQGLGSVGASSRNKLFHDSEAVIIAERGADALERKVHLNLEILHAVAGQKARVGVQRDREGFHPVVQLVLRTMLREMFDLKLIAVDQLLLGIGKLHVSLQEARDLKMNHLRQN